MLITKKLRQGMIYPQLKEAPIKTYADFLNFFRGGHTIDDNLASGATQSTMQYAMFSTAVASGHLTKSKNMAIPDEFLADIFLTEAGSELAQPALDRQFCVLAVAEARKSVSEQDGEPHPCVGAVVVHEGRVLSTGYRGETGAGIHRTRRTRSHGSVFSAWRGDRLPTCFENLKAHRDRARPDTRSHELGSRQETVCGRWFRAS